ncbi:MAG: hypothetical protein M3394_10525 [Actinomycetota bacterium]|nr:hypothetical protein [Actinomycetota bacterium]
MTPTTKRWAVRAAGVATVVAAAVVPAGLIFADSRADDSRREAVLAYEKAILPIVSEWGRIEVQGMRPAISDLRTDGEGVPPDAIVTEAQAWQSALQGIRRRLAEQRPPSSLRPAARLFDQAVVRYLEAAEAFEQAARATGDAREAGIADGIDRVREGSRLYNEASMDLQAARRRAGLEPTPDFPDHPAE